MASIGFNTVRGFEGTARSALNFGLIKIGILVSLVILFVSIPTSREIIIQSLSDAFLQVTVFVALTLGIFYFMEAVFRINLAKLLARHTAWQVPIAAALGALPGCGGAVIIITQFIRGGINFGSVVAVLTATMGDAAFLLLTQAPVAGIGVFTCGFAVGVVSGYLVNKIHDPDYLRNKQYHSGDLHHPHIHQVNSKVWRRLWGIFLIPGLFFGLLIAFQVNTELTFGDLGGVPISTCIGLGGAIISLAFWGVVSPSRTKYLHNQDTSQNSAIEKRISNASSRVVGDTCFVTVWVIFAFLIFELLVLFTGLNLEKLFNIWGPLVPLIAIFVGFIPGCGPQLLVTTMYINGTIPFSAELGNAISNDGDALFPAIAMAPKLAVIATLYSAIPALIVSYGYYCLFE
ncbi:MAG: hypothetical protein CMM44_01295 [Rhodospirillaceae bacterium]|nr:hypothetical protein [Rhodospirillaceae bacterium]